MMNIIDGYTGEKSVDVKDTYDANGNLTERKISWTETPEGDNYFGYGPVRKYEIYDGEGNLIDSGHKYLT